ncbi:antitoxin [Ornithinimicrobium sp. Y1694]|uniref:antitoxin n=1 Tax=Ornithinimicrobium sp. Y1694 TaxID=3418590 RepID=UPI003CF3A794
MIIMMLTWGMARTTVTLDSDVEAQLHRLMREQGLSFKAALNDTLRRGFDVVHGPPIAVQFPVYDLGRPSIDLTHALRVAADLEDEEIARELEVGR